MGQMCGELGTEAFLLGGLEVVNQTSCLVESLLNWVLLRL